LIRTYTTSAADGKILTLCLGVGTADKALEDSGVCIQKKCEV